MPDAFTVDVSPLDLENHKACVFRLGGSVDASSTQQLEEAVRGELDAGTRLCVLDFSGVDYVSSAGLRLLLKLRRSAADLGGGVKIAGLFFQWVPLLDTQLVFGYYAHVGLRRFDERVRGL